MAEQGLDGAQVHALFQQMRGKAVAQRMDVHILADTAVPGDQLDGLLDAAPIHDRRLAPSGNRLKRRFAPGKDQLRMAMRGPVAPQGLEGRQWQGHEPVLFALATTDMHPHQVAVHIRHRQMQGFAQTQAQAVGGEEIDLVAELAGPADEFADLLLGQDILQRLDLGRLDDGYVFPVPIQHILKETLDGIAGNLDQTPGAVFHQVHEVLPELIGAKLVGTGIEIIADLAQAPGIQIDGLVAFAAQGEFSEVALIQGLKAGMVLSIHGVSPLTPSRMERGQRSTDEFDPCRVAASSNQ